MYGATVNITLPKPELRSDPHYVTNVYFNCESDANAFCKAFAERFDLEEDGDGEGGYVGHYKHDGMVMVYPRYLRVESDLDAAVSKYESVMSTLEDDDDCLVLNDCYVL